jgi:hypothetical protein
MANRDGIPWKPIRRPEPIHLRLTLARDPLRRHSKLRAWTSVWLIRSPRRSRADDEAGVAQVASSNDRSLTTEPVVVRSVARPIVTKTDRRSACDAGQSGATKIEVLGRPIRAAPPSIGRSEQKLQILVTFAAAGVERRVFAARWPGLTGTASMRSAELGDGNVLIGVVHLQMRRLRLPPRG